MFKFLKEKLKNALSSIRKKVEEAPETETPVEEVKKRVEEEVKEEVKQQPLEATSKKPVEEQVQDKVEQEEKKLGIFGKVKEKIVTKRITEADFDELFDGLELILLENNVALDVVEKLRLDLKKALVDTPLLRKEVHGIVEKTLKNSIDSLFVHGFDVLSMMQKKKPFVIIFIGVNGSGKTTTLAKFAKYLLDHHKSCILVAADTFRAASIQQLEEHGKKLGVKVIKHDYGSDAGAVAFDGIKHAESKNIDVVLIDTAGRLHNNKDLMREMEKIVRVAKPDLKIFVGESITGNDCVEQAKIFDEAVGIDGIILTKADVDEKGGAAISISYVTKKPILFLGVGQNYADLQPFVKENILRNLWS